MDAKRQLEEEEMQSRRLSQQVAEKVSGPSSFQVVDTLATSTVEPLCNTVCFRLYASRGVSTRVSGALVFG